MINLIKLKFVIVLMLIFGLAVPSYAASYLMITDLGTSAEMIRRGNIEGFSQGSNAIFENPAALYRVNRFSGSVFQTTLMTDVEYRNISLAVHSKIGTFAIGYMDAGVSDIPKTVADGNPNDGNIRAIGSYKYSNRVAKAAYQVSLSEDFHIGINGVAYINEIDTFTGTGYNMDVGAIYTFSKLTMSLTVKNLIPSNVNYTDSEEDAYEGEEELPLQVFFGLAYAFGDLDILGQFKFDGINTLMSGGLDYTPGFLFNVLTLSAGYKEFSVLDKISNTITFGAGLNLFGLSLDYAYEKSDHFEYDANNFASVGFDF